jgi:hypothetical protein
MAETVRCASRSKSRRNCALSEATRFVLAANLRGFPRLRERGWTITPKAFPNASGALTSTRRSSTRIARGFSFDVARNAIVRGMTRIREDGDVERLGDRPFQDFLAFSEDLKISEFHPCDVAAGSCQTSDDSPHSTEHGADVGAPLRAANASLNALSTLPRC